MQNQQTDFLFVRHAETRWNHEQRYAGSSEVPLSEEASHQIASLTRLLIKEPIDAVYSSPLTRCLATVEPAAEILELGITVRPELRERFLGDWENKSAAELAPQYPGYHFPESAYNGKFVIPHAESMDKVEERLRVFIAEACADHPGQTILVGTHAGIIWSLMTAIVANTPLQPTWPRNGVTHRVRGTADRLEVIS